jgi:prevent-host-death family protein
MTLKNLRCVPAAEFKTHFGEYREAAQREPIGITNHGRTSVVLLSASEFERLNALDTGRAVYVSEIGEDDWSKIMADGDIPEASRRAQHELDSETKS